MDNSRKTLIEYFKKNLKKGYTEDALRFSLMNQGYSRTRIDEALRLANKELSDEAPKIKEKPKITHTLYDENDKKVAVKKKKSFFERVFG